jgi:hypothetical protein
VTVGVAFVVIVLQIRLEASETDKMKWQQLPDQSDRLPTALSIEQKVEPTFASEQVPFHSMQILLEMPR